ncbi:MAG: hypothetical protein AUK49_10450 [Betaproteobacteria bacterium CG2_30_68_42]|nr:MAG: hypothetical protein AUK49_10450 [Betaproteobacteria bacterium CG2_30_68_42]
MCVRAIPIDEAVAMIDLRAAMDELVGKQLAERITPAQLKEIRGLMTAVGLKAEGNAGNASMGVRGNLF